MIRLDSLRTRLIAALIFILFSGLAIDPALDRLLDDLVRDPYADLTILILLGLGAIGLIWLVSAWSLRQLTLASQDAARVTSSNPGARISTHGLPQELRPLVDAFNEALDRLAGAYEAERRFVANAAHELRTPLAVLSLRLQRAKLDGILAWSAIDDDITQLSRLVAQLLDLARKEHASQVGAGNPPVDLSRIAREAAAALVPRIEAAGRILEVDLPVVLPIRGRPDDLRDMISNLLDNAIVHGRGAISLTGQLAGDNKGRQAWITVSDEGEGVPTELRELVFRRFQKGSPESPGHGLGLAIAKEVARAHGGAVSFLQGPSCRVRIALPCAEGEILAKPRKPVAA